MSPYLLLPVSLGLVAVLQGSLNRRVAAHLTLPGAVVLTHAIALLCALAVLLVQGRGGLSAGPGRAAWWYAVPGLCGCAFVFGMPVAFGRLGVFQTLLALIAAQLVLGLCWDRLVEGRGVAPLQLVGAAVVLCGAILVLRR